MSKQFKDLTQEEKGVIIDLYSSEGVSRKEAQEQLAERFGVTERSIRNWAKELEIGLMAKNISNGSKILIYDIETPRLRANVWWSGKQFVNGNDVIDEPKIITVAWKWFGENKVFTKTWDENHDDRELVEVFLKEYNEADLVVGVNNNNFDNRWVNARAMKHGLHVNMFVKSLDLQKQMKRIARLPSYALKYMCKFFDVTMKLGHEGLLMWEMVQYGTPAQQKEYLKKMEVYNIGDIISTEEVYVKMIPYMRHAAHLGVAVGNDKYSCPTCGETEKLIYLGDTITPAGTIQRLMKCGVDGSQYKLSNREYLKWTTETI
jgi:hypothetical protein